jgi:hypothetical protein
MGIYARHNDEWYRVDEGGSDSGEVAWATFDEDESTHGTFETLINPDGDGKNYRVGYWTGGPSDTDRVVAVKNGGKVNALLIGLGGSTPSNGFCGGGGGGQFNLLNGVALNEGLHTISVDSSPGTRGTVSVCGFQAIGGGVGVHRNYGKSGGCGAGGAGQHGGGSGGAGTGLFGKSGGNGILQVGSNQSGGGGGGWTGAGAATSNRNGGKGGAGVQSNFWTGSLVWVCGGSGGRGEDSRGADGSGGSSTSYGGGNGGPWLVAFRVEVEAVKDTMLIDGRERKVKRNRKR